MNDFLLNSISDKTYANMIEIGKTRTDIVNFVKKKLMMMFFLLGVLSPLFYLRSNSLLLVGLTVTFAFLLLPGS